MEFEKPFGSKPSADRSSRDRSVDVIEISNLNAAERFKTSGGLVVASLFTAEKGSVDGSSPGLHQTKSFDRSDPGLCTRALGIPKLEVSDPTIGIAKPNKVAKAFVSAVLTGQFEHSNFTTPSGVDLTKLAQAIDAFDRDLVAGWPKGVSREERILMVANRYFSRMMAVEDLPKSVELLKELIQDPNFDQTYAGDLDGERDRANLALTFPSEVVRGDKLSISIIEESDPAGFHPGVYCLRYNTDLTLVVRSDHKLFAGERYSADGYISGFTSVSCAKRIDSEAGLKAVAAALNKLGLTVKGVVLDQWGGDETRFGWNRGLQVEREHCLNVAKKIAQFLSNQAQGLTS